MTIIKECNITSYLNQTESQIQTNGTIQQEFNKNSKITDYFDYLYSYPPKIQIKWDSIDELKEDLFISSNYGVLEHSVPFLDFIDDLFFTETSTGEAVPENYPKAQYVDGFVDKINSSNFFLKKTKKIQNALSNIPIFVILNGQGEIVLSKPSNVLGSKSLNNYVNEKLYDSCGAFDPLVEKKSNLGLFFMDQNDADQYFREVARSDFEGTQTVGLSIHCISLDSAYKITREHHPVIDFRIVPRFKEVKDLLVDNIGKSDMIVEDGQQQLRFRRRNLNLFPYLNKLGAYLSPSSSFLQRNEYFKGVPIYIVQLSDSPRSFWKEQYFNTIGTVDTIYSQCIQYLDSAIGFGHNWIMQGSLQDAGNSDRFENYIFFEKDQAIQFSKENGRKVARYRGGRTSNLESIIRKPKIFVYNLEDFIEDWEDQLVGEVFQNKEISETVLNCKATHFIPPTISSSDVNNFSKEDLQSPLKGVSQSLNVKFRVLKRAIGVFFSMS